MVFVTACVCVWVQKFCQKIKKFKIFFDIIINHTCVHMHIKKNFKIFHFLAKFLNLLEGPPIEFFLNRFFSTTVHSQTKFQIVSGWVLTFGLDPLPRELWIFSRFHAKTIMKLLFVMWSYKNFVHLKWHVIFSMPNWSWSSSRSALINCNLTLIFKYIKIITFFFNKKLLQTIWINYKNMTENLSV